ncbi:MAG: kelch repeat-containing protein, partial [bacterium]
MSRTDEAHRELVDNLTTSLKNFLKNFRFILGRRALIVFLAILVAAGALLGMSTATRTLAESPPPVNQEASAASVDWVVDGDDEPTLGPSSPPSLLQAGSKGTWILATIASSKPIARTDHTMSALPSGDVLLFGGYGSSCLNDTWIFNTATSSWRQITGSATPQVREHHAMATTASGVLLFGGCFNYSNYLNETWTLTLTKIAGTWTGTWTQLFPTPAPTARIEHAMAATPSGDVLLFGGWDRSDYLSDTWLFNTSAKSWSIISSSPSTPTGRYKHAMVATPSGVLLFGGSGKNNLGQEIMLDDTWLFTYRNITGTGTWTKLHPTTTPTKRSGHAMAALPSGDALLFGGLGSTFLNDTWLFDTTTGTCTWSQVSTSPSPTARANHAMATSSSGAILFGGLGNDTWLFVIPTISVTSPTPGATWAVNQ